MGCWPAANERWGLHVVCVCVSWGYLFGVCCHIAAHRVWPGGFGRLVGGVVVGVMRAVLCLPRLRVVVQQARVWALVTGVRLGQWLAEVQSCTAFDRQAGHATAGCLEVGSCLATTFDGTFVCPGAQVASAPASPLPPATLAAHT